jgi:hypothetical protein
MSYQSESTARMATQCSVAFFKQSGAINTRSLKTKIVTRYKSTNSKSSRQRGSQLTYVLRANAKHVSDLISALSLIDSEFFNLVKFFGSQPCAAPASRVTCPRNGLKVVRIYASSMETLRATYTGKIFVMTLMIYLKTIGNWAFILFVIQTVSQDGSSTPTCVAISTISNASLPKPATIFANSILRCCLTTIVTVYKRQWLAFNMTSTSGSFRGRFRYLAAATLTVHSVA